MPFAEPARAGVPRADTLGERFVGALFHLGPDAVRRMPGLLAFAIADLFSLAIAAFALWHERKVAPKGRGLFRNQRIVFRDSLTRGRSFRLFFGWARYTARLVVDVLRMPRITRGNLERYVDVRDAPKISAAFEEGRGLICVTGHMGLWELCGHTAALLGFPITSVARPIPYRPLQRLLARLRQSGGQRVISKWGAIREARRLLRRGEAVGLVVDEAARRHSVFVPFLGTLAATNASPALLHLRSGAPIVVATVNRLGRDRYRLHVWRTIQHAPTGDREADLAAVMAELNAGLGESIRRYPTQWFWGSRRYLRRPLGETPGPDGLPPRAPASSEHPVRPACV